MCGRKTVKIYLPVTTRTPEYRSWPMAICSSAQCNSQMKESTSVTFLTCMEHRSQKGISRCWVSIEPFRRYEWLCQNAVSDYLWSKQIPPFSFVRQYICFWSLLLDDHINASASDMSVYTSRFANFWSQIKQTWVIFTHLRLCVAVARHNFKWLKIR